MMLSSKYGDLIIASGEEVNEEVATIIEESPIDEVEMRSVLILRIEKRSLCEMLR